MTTPFSQFKDIITREIDGSHGVDIRITHDDFCAIINLYVVTHAPDDFFLIARLDDVKILLQARVDSVEYVEPCDIVEKINSHYKVTFDEHSFMLIFTDDGIQIAIIKAEGTMDEDVIGDRRYTWEALSA
jgi:hypothetical protein